jgi:hypothetical protein
LRRGRIDLELLGDLAPVKLRRLRAPKRLDKKPKPVAHRFGAIAHMS